MMTFDFVIDYLENSEDNQTMESYMIATEGLKEFGTKIKDGFSKGFKAAIVLLKKLILNITRIITSIFDRKNAYTLPEKAVAVVTEILINSKIRYFTDRIEDPAIEGELGDYSADLIALLVKVRDMPEEYTSGKYIKIGSLRNKMISYLKDAKYRVDEFEKTNFVDASSKDIDFNAQWGEFTRRRELVKVATSELTIMELLLNMVKREETDSESTK